MINRYRYDAWGRRRSTDNWTNYSVTLDALGTGGTQLFTRGFCFHEHLDVFGLINMNGRMYDPRLGRFLSPDPILQHPFNSQNYNRYSYCINNPLKYIDPSGYGFFKWLLGAVGVVTYPVVFVLNLPGNIIQDNNVFSTANDWYKGLRDSGQAIDNKFSSIFRSPNTNNTSIGGGNNYSVPYKNLVGDVYISNFPNFPNKLTPQKPNSGTCFTTSMGYLSNYYGGKDSDVDYANWYMNYYKDVNFLTNGITSKEKAEVTISNFFSINKISAESSVTCAIGNGNPIMANIYISTVYQGHDLSKPTSKQYHNVVIMGYNSTNKTYIIMDPATGEYERINQSRVDTTDPNQYLFEVTGIKP